MDRGRPRWRSGLVIGEMALAVVLLACGGLFVRGLQRFADSGPGWKVNGLLAGTMSLPRQATRTPTGQRAFLDRLQAAVARQPSVESVALADNLPLSIFAPSQAFLVEGRPTPPSGQAPVRYMNVVSADYFRTLGFGLADAVRVRAPAHATLEFVQVQFELAP